MLGQSAAQTTDERLLGSLEHNASSCRLSNHIRPGERRRFAKAAVVCQAGGCQADVSILSVRYELLQEAVYQLLLVYNVGSRSHFQVEFMSQAEGGRESILPAMARSILVPH